MSPTLENACIVVNIDLGCVPPPIPEVLVCPTWIVDNVYPVQNVSMEPNFRYTYVYICIHTCISTYIYLPVCSYSGSSGISVPPHIDLDN